MGWIDSNWGREEEGAIGRSPVSILLVESGAGGRQQWLILLGFEELGQIRMNRIQDCANVVTMGENGGMGELLHVLSREEGLESEFHWNRILWACIEGNQWLACLRWLGFLHLIVTWTGIEELRQIRGAH